MKTLWGLLFLAFWAGFFEFQRKNDDLKKRLEAATDTLLSIRSQREIFKRLAANRPFRTKPDMEKSAVVEWHRVSYSTDNGLFSVEMEVDSMHNVRSIFRKVQVKRPFSGDFKKVKLTADSSKMSLSLAEVRAFEKELSDLKFDSISIDDRDMFCCFGGGGMAWECEKKGQRDRFFETECSRAWPFAEACAAILLRSGDADARRSIAWMRR